MTAPAPSRFPLVTVLATLLALFAFLGLAYLAYNSPNYLGDAKTEPKVDGAAKLADVRAKNQAILDGTGAKMPVSEASAKLLGALKTPADRLPFPTPEPPAPAVADPKKK